MVEHAGNNRYVTRLFCSCRMASILQSRYGPVNLKGNRMTASPDIAELSFEQAMAQLEQVVSRLEQGDVTLDESIALYERGAKLRAHCELRLKSAEERVEKITLTGGQPSGTTPAEGL